MAKFLKRSTSYIESVIALIKNFFFAMLDALSPKLIISYDERINGTGNPYIYYREKSHVAAVVAEWVYGIPECDLLIYSHFLVVWMSPNDQEFIEAEKKEYILSQMKIYVQKKLNVKKFKIVHDESWEQLVSEMIERGERLITFEDNG